MKLIGDCNFCALCCIVDGAVCENLELTGKPGQPNASKCRVYDKRYNGMPIKLIRKDGTTVDAWCAKGSVEESMAIFKRGLFKGCSLSLVP